MDTAHWERFEPDLGENRKLPPEQRFVLEVRTGLTKVQLKATQRALDCTGLRPDLAALTEKAKTSKLPDESTQDAVDRVMSEWQCPTYAEHIATGLNPFVRVVGKHTLDGRTVESLRDYLDVIVQQEGWFNIIELGHVISDLNSVLGSRALFFARRSGGLSFTGDQSDSESGTAPH